jgi:hypothetical protein
MARERTQQNSLPVVFEALKPTPDETQIARTELVFRHVNEGIAETAEFFGSKETEFVCECADPECQHRLEVPLNHYEEVRADGAQFLVANDHEDPDYERVVKRRRGYAIVKKLGRGLTALVRRSDPRADAP